MNKDKYVVYGTIAFIISLLAISCATYAEPKPIPGCISFEALKVRVIEPLKNLRAVTPDKIAFVAELYNSRPPKTDIQWDTAYLIDGPDESGGLAVGVSGRVCGLMIFGGGDWKTLLDAIEPRT